MPQQLTGTASRPEDFDTLECPNCCAPVTPRSVSGGRTVAYKCACGASWRINASGEQTHYRYPPVEWLDRGSRSIEIASSPAPVKMERVACAADWPASLHSACDAFEAATNHLLSAATPQAIAGARAALATAASSYGQECLALEQRRRPDAYAK